MNEEVKISEAAEEIRNASEEDLRKVIEGWYEKTRTDGMRLGAKFISAGVFGAIQKHLNKPGKVSLRDYERCIKEIRKIIDVQLTKQNDSEEAVDNKVVEEKANDGTAE